MGLTSCQTPEQKAALAQQKAYETAQAEKERQIQQLVGDAPDLYRVLWKVCGDRKFNLNRKINGGCDEARVAAPQGFQEPLLMWGPVGEIQIDKKINPLSRDRIEATAFIKSRGCLTSGSPSYERLYKVREFLVDTNTPVSSENIKIERLSTEEKEKKIRTQVANVELTRDSRSLGLIGGGNTCESFDDWKKSNQNS
ncbi:hypothetical protein A6770_37000 [Nostoc minutum NIES-26]|uniref:Uncharacterized protein n=1 Tax=Nostoc minutum NIES-26 TaxID=1844469 RepID=A0A367RYV4_9NOSO|nr:hypothetical protein A6770_37000 [Nostoc minutum NIES-26]